MNLFLILSFVFLPLCGGVYYFIVVLSGLLFSVLLSAFYSGFFVSYALLSDEVTLFIVFILVCVMFSSVFWVVSTGLLVDGLLLFILLVCFIVFSTSNIFFIYLSYEASLLPIIFIIILYGSYPERSLSSLMLLLYTSVFSIPFMLVLGYLYLNFSTFSLYMLTSGSELPWLFSFILFFLFAVKLPLYGLHFWLPIAHVEAPTFGSMVLAGVLLNLGGVALIRCYHLVFWEDIYSLLGAYFLFGLCFSALVCCFQSDFNRLIAYSSVSHIMVIPLMLTTFSTLGLNTSVLVLIFHGFSSPLLFSIVGFLYAAFSTRQVVAIRGLVLVSPILSFVCLMALIMSLCMPPFPGYVSEVFFFLNSLSLWSLVPVVLVIFSVISLIYNLVWFPSIVFSTSPTSQPLFFSYTYSTFFSMIIIVLLTVEIILVFCYV